MDKIICFGKNYADHMTELGDQPVAKPVIFIKPPSILKQCLTWGEKINASMMDSELHYECELILKLSRGGYKMTAHEAKESLAEYTIGLDMTLRKEQTVLKKQGHPWTISKVFPDACIIGPWLPINHLNFLNIEFKLSLDNVIKQNSCGKNMLFSPIDLVVYASHFFPLCKDDILFTGTPAGVGPIHKNAIATLELGDYKYRVEWN